jgi:hypothetical protein
MRRRSQQVRHEVTKGDEDFVSPRWWSASAAERRYMAERDRLRAQVRPARPIWPYALLAVAVVLVLAIDSAPSLRGILANMPWPDLSQQPAPPVDPGDRNGLFHK